MKDTSNIKYSRREFVKLASSLLIPASRLITPATKLVLPASAGGLTAIIQGCGGGGGGTSIATELGGRINLVLILQTDKNSGRIRDFRELSQDPNDPDMWINDTPIFPDYEVERNDETFAYIEYVSPTDNEAAARREIRLLFDDGFDYLYIFKTTRSNIDLAIRNYSVAGYEGQNPEP